MRFRNIFYLILSFCYLLPISLFGAGDQIYKPSKWVDSMMASLSLDEKLGQLFMVSAYTVKEKENTKEVKKLIQKYHVGGVIFFKGGPVRTAMAINQFQSISKIPLMISIDGEWGLSMRLDSTLNYGYHMPLGACSSDSLTYLVGRRIGQECKRIGIQVNFGPVADVNNNPNNPVINTRSFGENKYEVAKKSILYSKGMQDEKVMACAKHFPGHGNTDVDSHYDLPKLTQSAASMDTLELYPFKKLFDFGVGSVMVAHLEVPAYDSTPHLATSMSAKVSTLLLRGKLGFNGLAFTDALNMKGATKYNEPGESEYKALLAGNDILLCPEYIGKAIQFIKAGLDSGCLDMEFIDERVRRILEAKYWMGLADCHLVDTSNLVKDLNIPGAKFLKTSINDQAVTLVRNRDNLLPLKAPDRLKIATLSIGVKGVSAFQEQLDRYWPTKDFQINMYAKDWEFNLMADSLSKYDLIIVGLHFLNNRSSTYGITDKAYELLSNLEQEKKMVLVNFSSPYVLSRFPNFGYLINAYQDDAGFQKSAAEIIFGGITSNGKLPVNASQNFTIGTGLNSGPPIRVEYTLPEEVGMSSFLMGKVDKIAEEGIKAGAMPGCQVYVAREGKIIYNKSFGFKTYDKLESVTENDLYDIASITKVASTTLVTMKLYESGIIDIDKKLGEYLPELIGTNKADLSLKEIMSHQGGLVSFIPFYKKTINNLGIADERYCFSPNGTFSTKIADRMYMATSYIDTMYQIMDASKIEIRGRYKYSDLGFIYMQRVIEKVTNKKLDFLVDSIYYNPMGLRNIGYLPLAKFNETKICPTEIDNEFRKQLIWGYVHDPTAAMFGGVSGHAGIFSTAEDLGILFQMLINNGTYGGRKFLEESTIKKFTSRNFLGNKRGLGWDKPEMDPSKNGPTSSMASQESYGHTGFTGTCVWADPQYKLVYVFLSNRVYPTANNQKLLDLNIRTRIHDAIYNAVLGRQDKPIFNTEIKN